MRKTIILDSGWVAAQVGNVQSTGFELTTTHPPVREAPKLPWMEGAVPGTILGTLLKNKLIPDPFYGLENTSIIDIADAGREYYTYWFFTAFNLSKEELGAHVWLQFRGINYQADVFLNGHKKSLPKGMFQRHLMDITEWVSFDKANLLAVLVHPPDHPGRIPPEGGQGGDHAIGQDVAAQYVEGWDWMCPIRDRNTGIWDEVSIFLTGPVRISDPHLVGSFFDDFKRVYLHTSVELQNATSKSQVCVVRLQVGFELEGDILSIEHVQEQEVSVPGGTTIMYTFPALFFYKPLLWWPNGMGKQNLYKVEIDVEVRGYGDSDSWSHRFGFRKIESHIDPSTGGRLFKVNGEPMFVRGGNWIVSDGLLRLSEERYKSDIDFHADMNFNMVRCWAGGITERPSFYENCDRRGVLVWEEFWITGDNDGRSLPDHPSNPNWPLDHELFLTCAHDTIKLLRNHPSLALWVGGNEQHPAEDLNTALQEYLKMHPFYETPDSLPITELPRELPQGYVDPSRYLDGTRIYIEGSLWAGFAKGNGEFTDGPYNIQYPESFFKDDFYPYGFNPELGSVGTPVAATIRATMPPEAWDPPKMVLQPNGYILEVPNATWTYHTYIPYSDPEKKVHDQIELYGKPKDLDDFCNKAQIVNYIQYRALMEGWNSHMWTKYTGGLIWKNQNPWTGLRGQFYDHLHDQTGSFFGVRLACEPIHVQLNLYDMFVEVVNTTASPLENVGIEATVWDLNGLSPYHQTSRQTIPQKKTVKVFEMQYPKSKEAKPVYFLLLKLMESNGNSLLSRNLYWLYLPGGSFKLLGGDFKTSKIPLRTLTRSFLTGTTCKINVQITNISTTGYTYNDDRITSVEESEGRKPLASLIRGFTELVLLPKKKLCSPHRPNETEIITASSSSGVAFWLHLSVHLDGKSLRPGNDTRILPVTYSNNYFSLVPGESMDVEISFQLPESAVPKLVLEGWNTEEHHVSFHALSVGSEGSASGI